MRSRAGRCTARRYRGGVRRLLLLLVVGLFLVGCGGSATPDTVAGAADDAGPAEPAPTTDAPASGGQADPSAPTADADEGTSGGEGTDEELVPFGTVTTVAGDQIDGGIYAGDSLALWFWAPW